MTRVKDCGFLDKYTKKEKSQNEKWSERNSIMFNQLYSDLNALL